MEFLLFICLFNVLYLIYSIDCYRIQNYIHKNNKILASWRFLGVKHYFSDKKYSLPILKSFLFFFTSFINFYLVHEVFICMSVYISCLHHVCGGQRKAVGPLGLELHMAVSQHVCTGN